MDDTRTYHGWKAHGLIVKKNSRVLKPTLHFNAKYNTLRREGEFVEAKGPEEFSLDYFQEMSDKDLAVAIEENRREAANQLRELEEFANERNQHDRLALLAFHTSLLLDACMTPKLHYDLNEMCQKIFTEGSIRPECV